MKSIRNQDYRTVASEMDKFETPRTNRTVVADHCTSPGDAIRPDGRPAESLARGGLQSLETIEGDDRCLNCHKRKKRYRIGRSSGHVRKLLSARLRPWSGRSPQMLNDSVPLVTQRIPSVVREPMHYEWIGRKSGTDADLPVPYNYLEIPDQILPNAFLQLAEEARELVVIEESSEFLEDVQSGASQWSGPPLMEVLTGGHHGPFGRESVDHDVTPGRLVGKRRIASADSGGLLDNWRTREDICDESGLVPEFRPVRNDRNTAPVVSGSRGFHRKGRQVRRDRSCPVGKQIMSEPSVRFVHKSDYMSDTTVKPEGQDGCFEGPTIVSRQYDSPSEGQGIDRPVNAERSVYTSAGPLGFRVTLGRQITDWPDPVEPPGMMQQVIFPRPTADREGCISADSVHPAVTMFSAQPVAAGLSDPIAVRRSVDIQDAVGLEVGGPVGRVPYSELRQTDVESILHSNRRDDVVASRSGTTEHPDDRSGDIDCADTTYDELDKFAGEWDPLVEKDNGCQLVRVNGGLDDCLTNSRDVSGSSDSGVQSWMEQWDNMSDNSMDGSYVDTGDLHRSVSDELARLLFDAPPNTEDEDASGSPGTDGSVTGMLHKCQPEAMFEDDRNLSCNDMADSEYDSNSDLEEHSDVSDDSSVLGIRKVLRRRVPYRGRAPLPRKGCARAPRTPPVPPRNRAEQWLLEHNSIRSSWARWSYGYMMDYTSERFVPFIRALTNLCLEEGEDPRRDRYYPKLVQSLARAGRVVRTVPRCHENHRLRRDWMLRLFDEEMEKSDLACDRFPDRQADLVAGTTKGRPPPTEVRETFTPPIRRCRRRKSAALRECLSDVEDYFENAAEKGLWTARALAWYQPCL